MMEEKTRPPRITHLSWGSIKGEDQKKPFKDATLFPGGSKEWDWRETGTQHVPGIQPADVEELLKHGATEVILSKGMYDQLHVCPATLHLLNQKGITTHIL